MDQQQIYEDLKTPLGDAAARSIVRALATVYAELRDTVTREDLRILRDSIDDNIARLDRGLASLAEAQSRTETRVEQLAEAQARTEARVEQLAEAQSRTEARVEQLTEAQAHTEQTLARLVESQGQMQLAIQRLTIRTDAVVGRTLELQFRDRIGAYLGLFMRRCRLVDAAQLIDALEPRLDSRELADVLRADAIASGQIDGRSSHVVVEVSAAADVEDIERARRQAGLLRKAGLEAVAIVACEAISPESRAFARQADVHVWLDGRMMEVGDAA